MMKRTDEVTSPIGFSIRLISGVTGTIQAM
jgi:hypothetical protein